MVSEATNKTIDEQLTEFEPVAHHGWADDGRGSIDVELSPVAEREDIIQLHKIAGSDGYRVSFEGEEHDGTTHWRLLVE